MLEAEGRLRGVGGWIALSLVRHISTQLCGSNRREAREEESLGSFVRE